MGRVMHFAFVATLALASLAVSGCSGDGGHASRTDFTCPDGSIITAARQETDSTHHEAAFDPATLCPIAPRVLLQGLPATLGAYRSAAFTWAVDPGSVAHGHSLLTSIRYGNTSVATVGAVEDYASELVKREHQDLPVTFKGNLTFTQAGMVYLRAYAQVQGETYARRDVWSDEVAIAIQPVAPTGTVHTVTHAAGLLLGEVTPAEPLDALLGDAVQFDNQDVTSHALTLSDGPKGASCIEITADAGQTSAACVLEVPGTYTWQTDDEQPKTVEMRVTVSA